MFGGFKMLRWKNQSKQTSIQCLTSCTKISLFAQVNGKETISIRIMSVPTWLWAKGLSDPANYMIRTDVSKPSPDSFPGNDEESM